LEETIEYLADEFYSGLDIKFGLGELDAVELIEYEDERMPKGDSYELEEQKNDGWVNEIAKAKLEEKIRRQQENILILIAGFIPEGKSDNIFEALK